MEILIKKRKPETSPINFSRLAQPSPYDRRYGEWGRVELLHSEDNSVDIFLDIGIYLKRVPVSSREWVVPGEDAEKDYNSGERDLPPEHARVFIMMPTGTFNDCFVLCSGFATIEQTPPYMEYDREKIKERITPSGWHITDDYVTGSHKAVSPDEKTSLEIDYGTEDEPKEENPELHLDIFNEIKADVVADTDVNLSVFDEVSVEHKKGESVKIAAFGEVGIEHKKGDSIKITTYDTDITIKQGEVTINSKKSTVNVTGDFSLIASGKANIQATGPVDIQSTASAKVTAPTVDIDSPAVTIKSAATVITGGTLTSNGTAAPTGTGPFCGVPVCPFGFPHTGNVVAGG
jgi:hypothetical protein